MILSLLDVGIRFYVMTDAFAMDIVHPEYGWYYMLICSSKYRIAYIEKLHSGAAPNMRLLCYDYQKQLEHLYPTARNQTKICAGLYSSLYWTI